MSNVRGGNLRFSPQEKRKLYLVDVISFSHNSLNEIVSGAVGDVSPTAALFHLYLRPVKPWPV